MTEDGFRARARLSDGIFSLSDHGLKVQSPMPTFVKDLHGLRLCRSVPRYWTK